MAVIALIAILVLWQFWISPSVADTSVPLFVRSFWAAYPMLDAILLAVVLRTILAGHRSIRMGVSSPAVLVCWLVSDFSS